jgi:hypothetical protein
MLRPYTTDLPARVDLEFRTNSDKTFGVAWNKTDGSGVPTTAAVVTFEFDVFPPPADGEIPNPTRLVIDGYDPASTTGHIDPDLLVDGIVMVTIRHGAWSEIVERSGNYDLQATSTDGLVRVLERGIFTVEDGVT